MATRGGDLDGPAAESLAPHIGQVRRSGDAAGAPAGRRAAGPGRLATEDGHQIGQRGRTADLRAPDQGGLPDVAERHHEAERTCSIGQGDHAADVAQRAVEPEFATEGHALGAARAQLAGRHEQPHRDREVEAGAALADTGGRQIDGHPPQGPRETAREHGGAHPVPRLTHGGIGEPDDGETGEAVGDMDLDRDGTPEGTVQRRGLYAGQHGRRTVAGSGQSAVNFALSSQRVDAPRQPPDPGR